MAVKKSVSPFLGFDKVAELLIEKGANVNIKESENNTAFILAARKGNKDQRVSYS